jgi:DNA primase
MTGMREFSIVCCLDDDVAGREAMEKEGLRGRNWEIVRLRQCEEEDNLATDYADFHG